MQLKQRYGSMPHAGPPTPPRYAAPYNPQYRAPIPPPLPPHTGQARLMWSIVGAVIAFVALLIVLVLATGGDDTPASSGPAAELVPAGDLTAATVEPRPDPPTTGSRDEAALHRLVDDFTDAAVAGPTSNWMDYYCAADRAVILRNGDGDVIVPTKGFDERTRLTGVTVTGTRASGYLDAEPAQFQREAGRWTFCMTL